MGDMAEHITHEVEEYATGELKAATKHTMEEHEYDMGEHHEGEMGEHHEGEEYAGEYEYDEMGDVEMDAGAAGAGEYEANVAATEAGSILATQDNSEHQMLEEEQAPAGEYYEDKDGEPAQDMYEQAHMYEQTHVDAGSMDYSMISPDAGNSSLDALSQVISSSVGHLSEMAERAHDGTGDAERDEAGSVHADGSAADKDRESAYGHSPSPGTSTMQYKGRMGDPSIVTPVKRPLSSHSGDGSSNSRLKSKVWNWYDILADGHRQCRFCAQKYGRLTATTILARHYHNRHGVSSMTPTAHRTSHRTPQSHAEGAMAHIAISQAGQAIYSRAAAAAAVAAAASRNDSPDTSGHLFHAQTNGEAYGQNSLTNGTSEDLLRSVSEAVQQHEQGQFDNNQLMIHQDGFSPMIASPLTGLSLSSAHRAFAAVGQFCAQGDMNKNLQTCVQLISGAARRGARMVFLPEASDFIAENRAQAAQQAQTLDGAFMKEIQQAAKDNNIWVSVGMHEQQATGLPYNTNAVVSDEGMVVAAYRKLHLFDVNVKDGPRLLESTSSSRGDRVADVVDTPVGRLGLAVCYDMRFPELAQSLRARGAQLLSYPSAFTEPTGAAHWEVLLRARAVETQTYVFAAAQIGRHSAKRSSYGDAMIVDPWGVVVARCSRTTSEPLLALAEINIDYLEKVRREMPVFSHKRPDIFSDYSS